MTKWDKRLEKMRRNPKNVSPDELDAVLRAVAYYMSLPYRVELIPDEGGWFVSIPDLPGCMSQGETPDQALEMIRDA